jgi:hypothetical protein
MKQRKASYKYSIKKLYGLSLEDFENILELQDGVCRICKRPDRRLCVDHDHTTGKVRGILCATCNKGLGLFQDNENLMKEAAKYIEDTKCNT